MEGGTGRGRQDTSDGVIEQCYCKGEEKAGRVVFPPLKVCG